MSIVLGDAVANIQAVHLARVNAYEYQIHDERTLGCHPEAERPTEDLEAEFASKEGNPKGDRGSDRKQRRREPQTAAPALAVGRI
jgi:hypothetical protein